MRRTVWIVLAGFVGCLGTAVGEPWLYQLQNPNARTVRSAGFSAAVLDYSRDGSDAGRLPSAQMRGLRRAGITALAYLSIGEAENYRFYWQSSWIEPKDSNRRSELAPTWLGRTDPDWRGNYKVRYWDPAWREAALRPYLDRILRQGFRGVYLDIIDGFEYWAEPGSYGTAGETFRPGDPRGNPNEAARRMIDLVVWIAEYTRAKAGRGFQVFPQNAEEILRYDGDGRYRRAISGIGIEDLFYDQLRAQRPAEVNYRLKVLRSLRAAGKSVLCVDYVDTGNRSDASNAQRIEDFVRRCEAEGFDFYVARWNRDLGAINRIPGVQP